MSKHDEFRARERVTQWTECRRLAVDAIAAVGELETLVAKLREGVVQEHEGDREYLVVCGCCSASAPRGYDLAHTTACAMKETST